MKINFERIVGRNKGAVKQQGFQNSEYIANALISINESLEDLEDQFVRENQGDSRVLVISYLPRSGSTYLYQLLCRTGRYNYVSNFQSRFWRTPCVGRLLENSIGVRDYNLIKSQSNLGMTQGWESPSEFNYFWEERLGISGGADSVVDEGRFDSSKAASLSDTISAMSTFEDKPLLFKKEWLGMNADTLRKCFPRLEFIHLNRDREAVIKSMLRARTSVYGESGTSIFGASAPDYTFDVSLSLRENIEIQIDGLDLYLRQELAKSGCPVHEINYEDLLDDTDGELNRLEADIFSA